jgi:hypothetical protein
MGFGTHLVRGIALKRLDKYTWFALTPVGRYPMPSKTTLREAWSAADRQQYSEAVEGVASSEKACWKKSGTTYSFDQDCMKKAFSSLKGKSGKLATVWSE